MKKLHFFSIFRIFLFCQILSIFDYVFSSKRNSGKSIKKPHTGQSAKIDLNLRNGTICDLRLLAAQTYILRHSKSSKTFALQEVCNPRIHTPNIPEIRHFLLFLAVFCLKTANFYPKIDVFESFTYPFFPHAPSDDISA